MPVPRSEVRVGDLVLSNLSAPGRPETHNRCSGLVRAGGPTILNKNLRQAQLESSRLRRSLDGARANVKRERERNVTQLFAE